MLTFDLLCPAWAERADRRRNRCAVAGAPVPRPRQGRASPRRKPGDRQAPFSNPRAASGSLLPDSFPNRISRWLHHIHPIHCHHTVPTHLRNRPICLVPVEDCEGCPALAGVRNVGLDSLTRRCSDQGCNFGTRAGLNSAAIPALRALDTADTGSPFAKKPVFATSVARYVETSQPSPVTTVRPDCAVIFYRDVFECHVALHESEAALLLTPGGFQIYFRAHETPGHAASTIWASSRSSGPPAAKQNCNGSNNACARTIPVPDM